MTLLVAVVQTTPEASFLAAAEVPDGGTNDKGTRNGVYLSLILAMTVFFLLPMLLVGGLGTPGAQGV